MTIDPAIVQRRLSMMDELLNDLQAIGEVTTSRLETDRIVRHAVERILTQLVDLAVSINSHLAAATDGTVPEKYRESYAAATKAGAISAELAPSAGLRNILTHEYVAIDLGIVADAVPAAYDGYRRYVAEVARFVRQEREER